MLYLIRHGRTASNASGLLLGRADPPLDELGRRQAARLGEQLPGSVGRVISSPLARTRETAAALGRPVTVDERWIELDYGEWDGRPVGDVGAEQWAAWRADDGFAPPGGESLRDLGSRVRAACEELAEEATDHDIAVVSHVSPVKAAVAWALGVGDGIAWRMFVAPASVTTIRTGGGRALVGFNQTTEP